METIRRRRLGDPPDRKFRVERFSTVREQKPRLDARSSTRILGAQRNHQSIPRIGGLGPATGRRIETKLERPQASRIEREFSPNLRERAPQHTDRDDAEREACVEFDDWAQLDPTGLQLEREGIDSTGSMVAGGCRGLGDCRRR